MLIVLRLETVKAAFDSQGQYQRYVYRIYKIVWLDTICVPAKHLTALTINNKNYLRPAFLA